MHINRCSVRAVVFLVTSGAALASEGRTLAEESLPLPPQVYTLPRPPMADAPADFLLPGPVKVPVQIESDGPPLQIDSVERTPLCRTPCTLHLAPGGTPLHLGGPERLESDTIFDVRPGGQRVLLYSAARSRVAYAVLGIAGGSLLTLLGGLALIPAVTDDPSISGVTALRVFSGTTLGIGLGALTAGLLTLKWTHTGVKRIEPLPPSGSPRVAQLMARAQ